MRTFPTPHPVDVLVDVTGFDLRVRAADVAEATVELRPHDPGKPADVELAERTTVDLVDGRLVLRSPRTVRARLRNLVTAGPRADVSLTVPTGSSLEVRGWGDIAVRGELGAVDLDTSLGDIALDRVGRLRAKTSMGDIRADATTGPADVRTSAGSIRVERATAGLTARTAAGDVLVGHGDGELHLTTSAGDVRVDRALASVSATTSAGDVRLGSVRRGTATATSSYGSIEIGIAEGTAAWLDVTTRCGAVRSELDQSDGPGDADRTVEVRATTGFGDVVLRRS